MTITLPIDDRSSGQPELSGHCRIDFRKVEYRIDESDGSFSYRHGDGPWEKRWIAQGWSTIPGLLTLWCVDSRERALELFSDFLWLAHK
jgi:hypothetical protein